MPFDAARRTGYRPLNSGFRFSRNAVVPSRMSSVDATRPNSVASNRHAFGERHLEPLVDGVDDVAHRDRRLPGELRRELLRLGHQLRRRHDAVDEPDALGLARADRRAGQNQLHRPALPDEARQPLRAGVAGKDAEVDFGLAEPGGVGREPQRARHRELAAAAERVAVDRGDDRLAQVLDEIEHVLAGERVLAARDRRLHRQLVDVGAGDERLLARAGEDDDAHRHRRASDRGSTRRSSSSVAVLSALRTLGRLIVTIATAPSRSRSRLSKAMAEPNYTPRVRFTSVCTHAVAGLRQ